MATDQEIRDRGIKFLPSQKYLQNPYEFPVEEEAAPVNQGIVNTNAFTGGGGDNFNSAGNAFGYGSQIEYINDTSDINIGDNIYIYSTVNSNLLQID